MDGWSPRVTRFFTDQPQLCDGVFIYLTLVLPVYIFLSLFLRLAPLYILLAHKSTFSVHGMGIHSLLPVTRR